MTEPRLAPALRPFEGLGRWVIGIVESLGRFGSFLGQALAGMVTPPFKFGALLGRIHYIGFRSLLIILLTGAFTGMVLGLQIFFTLSRFGSEAFLGPAVALTLIRELGPVLGALMVTGRAGSALTAELGIMRITEQIDALTVMALSPMRYLVGVKLLGLSEGTYFGEMQTFVGMSDIMTGFWKSISFGVIVTWVCTYKGFHVTRGAEGVARATTQAVVLSSVLILVWDYFLGSVLP